MCSAAQKEFTQFYPKPGWVEHDPLEIWSSQLSVAVEAMGKIGAEPSDIAAIGITNQRETTICFSRKTGRPIYNAICWQCRRTAEEIDRLKEEGFDRLIRERTGLIPDAYFSGTKIKWILDHVEGARRMAEEGELLFGTVDTWLIWNLTKGKVFVTDYTNASRTMLFDIHKKEWDEDILKRLGIPKSMLPEVKPSSCIYGHTEESVLFGQCCFEAGEAKNTYGTGCFLLMNTGETPVRSENGLLTTIAASTEGELQYALEGSVFVAGAAIQWLRDELRMIRSAPQSEEYASAVEDTDGVYVVPAFTGLGAPYWDMYARGCIVGITRGTNRAHFARAVLEGITYQMTDLLRAMKADSAVPLKELRVDGGASVSNIMMQIQANIAGCPVNRPKVVETTALGAAYLAGLAVGFWGGLDEISQIREVDRIFFPEMTEDEREKAYAGWQKAVQRAQNWAERE